MHGDLKFICKSMIIRALVILFLFSSCTACKDNKGSVKISHRPGKNEMADLNKYLVQKDRERIKNYIERKNLQMVESPTGLWYQIIEQGDGKTFTDNDKVVIDFDCSLLDGTKCYSSEDLGPKEVVIGKSVIEPGLNEGLKLLKPGSKAIFIIPPFLAFGLIGDRKMIPARSVIVYYVNILQNNNN